MACAISDYYDVMLVGKAGRGKSTLGNKLLQVLTTEPAAIKNYGCGATPAANSHLAQSARFLTASDFSADKKRMISVTQDCQLLSNENTRIRVMDTPGFVDGKLSRGRPRSVYEETLFTFRKVLREHGNPRNRLKFRRIVYFLPERGVLEKAAGDLQDELKVMHYFYGDAIFNCMVIIATNPPKKKIQDLGMDEEDLQETKEVFQIAMQQAVPTVSKCPPIVYMGLNDTDTEALAKIKGAKVLKDEVFAATFRDNICSKCGVKIRFHSARKDKRIGIINPATNEILPYEDSKCHPYFVQKFSTAAKFFGGLGHIVTLGTGLTYSKITGEESWPGFANSEEICPRCKCSPGSEGCCVVKETTYEGATVDHTSHL